jgi:hypothetical protein
MLCIILETLLLPRYYSICTNFLRKRRKIFLTPKQNVAYMVGLSSSIAACLITFTSSIKKPFLIYYKHDLYTDYKGSVSGLDTFEHFLKLIGLLLILVPIYFPCIIYTLSLIRPFNYSISRHIFTCNREVAPYAHLWRCHYHRFFASLRAFMEALTSKIVLPTLTQTHMTLPMGKVENTFFQCLKIADLFLQH